jgi:hypothetical protein
VEKKDIFLGLAIVIAKVFAVKKSFYSPDF